MNYNDLNKGFQVTGSSPDESLLFLFFFFSFPNPSNHIVVLGFNKLLIEMSTRDNKKKKSGE
jgi:hypothetical protein